MQKHTKIKCFFGFDEIDKLMELKKAGEPFIFMDHAYFKRGYHYENYRAIWCDIHQRKILDVPDDRKELFKISGKLREWKQGEKVIVIPIPPNPERFYEAYEWTEKTVQKLKTLTDREIFIKKKADGNLREHLLGAWGVVSHSSVAGVEAATWGVPVFGPDTSPAFHMGQEIEKIESPIFPDRDKWVASLTYSQFHISEIASGKALEIIHEYHDV